MIGKMIVGFDASVESYQAFDFALDMACSCQPASDIFVLTVVQPPEGVYLVASDKLLDETTKQYEGLLKDLEEKAKAKKIRIRTEIAVGHPAETIVRFAEEMGCPLIIVGHKGRSKLQGMLLGSVSRSVASLARCTVIIVRKEGS
ncbi:MAG: universal stress protein [Desulfobacteraceae bacterium]|nr:universal stress protein [Desulfobacteraceae bacterium]